MKKKGLLLTGILAVGIFGGVQGINTTGTSTYSVTVRDRDGNGQLDEALLQQRSGIFNTVDNQKHYAVPLMGDAPDLKLGQSGVKTQYASPFQMEVWRNNLDLVALEFAQKKPFVPVVASQAPMKTSTCRLDIEDSCTEPVVLRDDFEY